jgi:hypothetical protein
LRPGKIGGRERFDAATAILGAMYVLSFAIMRTPHRVLSYLTTVMAGIALVPAAAFAQEPLKLNVPRYRRQGRDVRAPERAVHRRRADTAKVTTGITEDSWTRVWRPSSNSSNAAV